MHYRKETSKFTNDWAKYLTEDVLETKSLHRRSTSSRRKLFSFLSITKHHNLINSQYLTSIHVTFTFLTFAATFLNALILWRLYLCFILIKMFLIFSEDDSTVITIFPSFHVIHRDHNSFSSTIAVEQVPFEQSLPSWFGWEVRACRLKRL